MQGKIIKGIAGFYYVYGENEVLYECKAKGVFRKDNQKPLVGDNVEITVLNEQKREGNLTRILPRKNSLIRPAVANVDQAFVIFAMDNPKPNFMLLDRFLIMMEQADIPAVICFNKKDLATEKETQELYQTYQSCGYQVLLTSALEEEGIDEIHRILKGKTTVVAGPSGVGKSSLTNLLQAEVQMETGEISRKLKRGKHTTRHSQVIPVGENTFLMDTPGFSSLYLMDMEEQELKDYFPEFRKYDDQCRFQGCRHIHEPGCRVKEALEQGEISRIRYPYENCIALGEQSLTDTELIAAIIKTGVSGKPAGELAKDILDKSHNKGLLGLFDMSIDELMDIKGIGLAKAAQLKCICELSRRLAKQSAGKRLDFSSPYAIAEYYMQDMRHLTKERLVLVMLDSRLNLIKDSVISIGTVNSSLVSVKEVFSEACKNKAVSIVLIHNHPSGDPAPSPQDISVTEQIRKAGLILGIHLIDHIIIGDNNFTSLNECGYLRQ